MLLSKNARVQQKLYEELCSLIDDSSEVKLTYDDLNRMKYLENVIKETLRLYPSVPIIGRLATTDIELTSMFMFL
jgi:cytochrome P450 family 4